MLKAILVSQPSKISAIAMFIYDLLINIYPKMLRNRVMGKKMIFCRAKTFHILVEGGNIVRALSRFGRPNWDKISNSSFLHESNVLSI